MLVTAHTMTPLVMRPPKPDSPQRGRKLTIGNAPHRGRLGCALASPRAAVVLNSPRSGRYPNLDQSVPALFQDLFNGRLQGRRQLVGVVPIGFLGCARAMGPSALLYSQIPDIARTVGEPWAPLGLASYARLVEAMSARITKPSPRSLVKT